MNLGVARAMAAGLQVGLSLRGWQASTRSLSECISFIEEMSVTAKRYHRAFGNAYSTHGASKSGDDRRDQMGLSAGISVRQSVD